MKGLEVPLLTGLNDLPLNEAAEVMAASVRQEVIGCVNWATYGHKPEAMFRVARSAKAFYVWFGVRGLSLRALCRYDGEAVHRDSCVEFFMRKADEATYRNFEFNALGVCDASVRLSRSEKIRPLDAEEYAAIGRYGSIVAPVEVREGVFAWELTVSIPFVVMGLEADRLPDRIWGNFYKCGDETAYPHYLSWAAVQTAEPDFHRPEYFAPLVFAEN
jgi:hypothetical protein